MSVVENDPVVSQMLRDELARCREMVAELERASCSLPRGSLSERKKRYLDKEYTYHTLKFRQGRRVISQHVAAKDVQALSALLDQRRRYDEEIAALRKRIAYLEKLLGVGSG